MKTLLEILKGAEARKVAVGHFNIADLVTLKAIVQASDELKPGEKTPVIIGTSEGERDFLEIHNAVSAIRDLRENHGYPIFLNADHTHSVEKAKEAIDAGYDAVLFDGGKLPMEENIARTKEVVDYARAQGRYIYIEGELGYIGSSSKILTEVPEGAEIEEKDLTTPEDAKKFVDETGIDFLAPAVGNLHGMFKSAKNPHLVIDRIAAIEEAVKIPLVLHGGSGTPDGDFIKAIDAGVGIIHINTELRVAWREGMEEGLREMPDEIAPYRLMKILVEKVKEATLKRIRLFNKV